MITIYFKSNDKWIQAEVYKYYYLNGDITLWRLKEGRWCSCFFNNITAITTEKPQKVVILNAMKLAKENMSCAIHETEALSNFEPLKISNDEETNNIPGSVNDSL